VMDCFVFPSRYEGLGLVVVEAQAAGLPCIISDRIPTEAIVDHSMVLVLPLEASPEEWAAEVLRVVSLKHTRNRSSAVDRVESSRFNLDSCAALLWERYAQFSQQSSGHP
jgi:glycosyltransferase involved in cell wall biosynthesis